MVELLGRVPVDILSKSSNEKVDFFERSFIMHYTIKEARDRLLDNIKYRTSAKIIMIFGATGVGKTTLRNNLVKEVTLIAAAAPDEFNGRIPIAGIDLDSPDDGNMSWRDDYYIPALKALHEPLIDKKIDYHRYIRFNEAGELVIGREIRKADLREALKTTLKNRRPLVFWIDSAQHLTKVASGKKLIDQVDTLKALTDACDTRHVLFATHELVTLVNLSPELARRSVYIQLRRYSKRTEADWRDFRSVLKSFQERLPVLRQPDLVEHADYFYQQSHGCVGRLKDLLTSALDKALNQGSDTVAPEHWRAFEQPTGVLETNLSRIQESERLLQSRLESDIQYDQPVFRAPKPEKRQYNKRPGQRKPKRDPVSNMS